jgi:hypothetical protein
VQRVLFGPNIEGMILGLDFAAGSCEMYDFLVYLHEMSVYFTNRVHC